MESISTRQVRAVNNEALPRWLVILLVAALLVFVGPPLLALLLGALGIALVIGGLLFKLALYAFVAYAAYRVLKAVFGSKDPSPTLPVPAVSSAGADWETEQREAEQLRRAELDRELERAIAQRKRDEGR